MPPPSDNGRGHHVIVCGVGPLGRAVMRALAHSGARVICVGEEAVDDEISDQIDIIEGDPTSEALLREALIEGASAIISTVKGDEKNALICLVARSLNPGVRLVARGETVESIRILESLGADAVVCPEVELGLALASAALERTEQNRKTL